MKKSKFSDSQIIEALKRVEGGLSVPELCRELGISSATFYKWRAKYGGLDVSMMARMKELEAENARLKKMYAEERLKADILKEYLGKKGASDFPVDGEHGNSRPDRSPFGFSGVRRRSFELACRVLIPQTSTALMRCRIALACNIRRY